MKQARQRKSSKRFIKVGLINTNCPNCGGILKIDNKNEKLTCEFCGAELLVENKKIRVSNAFETGYEFEKGRKQFLDDETSSKKQKKMFAGSHVPVINVIVASVLLIVMLGLSIFGVVVFSASPYDMKDGEVNVYKLQSTLYTRAIVAAMPKSIEGDDNGRKVKFYIEVNDKYEVKEDEPITQYLVYYYDADGKRQDLPSGIYKGSTEDMYPLIGFFIAGMNSLKALKAVITTCLIFVCLAIAALAIYLAYLLISVKKDRAYSPSYQAEKKKKAEQKAKAKNKK